MGTDNHGCVPFTQDADAYVFVRFLGALKPKGFYKGGLGFRGVS